MVLSPGESSFDIAMPVVGIMMRRYQARCGYFWRRLYPGGLIAMSI